MNQREAVYSATLSVLTENGVIFEEGQNVRDVMTDSIRKSIVEVVFQGFKTNSISFKDKDSNAEKLTNDTKLRSYVIGLVNNWHRKDKCFNGGTKYAPKNPGSRAGQGDSQLKALRQLKTKFSGDAEKTTQIQTAIEKRTTELSAEKAKKVEVDYSQIPAELLAELGIES